MFLKVICTYMMEIKFSYVVMHINVHTQINMNIY